MRISGTRGPWLDRLGPDIGDALAEHPLAPFVEAIALIGAGDPFLIRPGDPPLKVMVPLLGDDRADAMTRQQLSSVDALVLIDPGEVPPQPGDALLVRVEGASSAAPGFLERASDFDTMQAITALGDLPDLRLCIQRARPEATKAPITARQIADTVVEAAIAAGGARD